MRFNWEEFCKRHYIPYVERGANVARGNINISCPYCRDPSEHMGLSLEADAPHWSCWRCKKSGRHPGFLMRTLVPGLTKRRIEEMTEAEEDPFPDDFDSLFNKPIKPSALPPPPRLVLPAEARPWSHPSSIIRLYESYLEKVRCFDSVKSLGEEYSLHYAISGRYARRIILPVVLRGRLMAWSARSICGEPPRYLTSGDSEIKKVIANFDPLSALSGGRLLVVVEGPFDFLKVDWFGRGVGIRATCLFGTTATQPQLALLAELVPRFDACVIVLDRSATAQAALLAAQLGEVSGRLISWGAFPHLKDPGEMTRRDIGYLNKLVGKT